MPRYIDANKIVVDAIQERRFVIQTLDIQDHETTIQTVYADLADFIAAQPTADVVEVRRGEWVERDGKTWCSLCDKSNKQYKPPFCPHCGADMRESGKAEEDKEVKIGEMFSEMKLVIHEGNGMMFTEADGKIESLPNSTVGIKLTYRGKQYGVVCTFEKPKLDTVDIVTAVNSMFEDLKDAEAFRL